jgi:hypothetical protein
MWGTTPRGLQDNKGPDWGRAKMQSPPEGPGDREPMVRVKPVNLLRKLAKFAQHFE